MTLKTQYRILFLLLFSLSIPVESVSQCNDTLIKTALYESGSDALFIRDFKIKFTKGKTGRPAKVAKYSVFLNDSTRYRFNIVNAKEYDGKAVMQLFSNGKLYGSTYDFDSLIYKNQFDFECPKNDYYQIYMSFLEGETGCAAGVLSYVITDSSYIPENEGDETLYVNIENPLYIAYTDEPNCHLRVFSSQGTITGYNGKYSVIPDTTGVLIITAQTVGDSGTIIEEIVKEFKVKSLPNPVISINGNTGGTIDKTEIISARRITALFGNLPNSENYKIVYFELCENYSNINCYSSDSEFFSYRQMEMIEKLKSGSRIQLSKVKVLKPDGEIILLKPVDFIIR